MDLTEAMFHICQKAEAICHDTGEEVNIIAHLKNKGKTFHIIFYNNESVSEVLRSLGRFASNPNLDFSWRDAAVMAQRVRQEYAKQQGLNNRMKL